MMKGQIPFHDRFPLIYNTPAVNRPEGDDHKISLKDAITFVASADVLSYYRGVQDDVMNVEKGDSHVFRRAKHGEEKARITLAVIAAFEEATDLGVWRQGNGRLANPQYRTYLLLGMMFVFTKLGYLPHDEQYDTEPSFLTADARKLATETPSGRWRRVWSYSVDFSKLTPSSSDTSHTVRYEEIFCRGFAVCYATGSIEGGDEKWHTLGDSDGNLGFFREQVDNPANFALDYSFAQNLLDHQEEIVKATVIIAELVVDVYTGGATAALFASVNKFLFPFVHAMCTGDSSQLLNSTIAMAGDLAKQGIKIAETDVNVVGGMTLLKTQAKKTYEFFVAKLAPKFDSSGNQLFDQYGKPIMELAEGVGASMAKVVGQARTAMAGKVFPGENSIAKAIDAGTFAGLPYGKQVLSAAHLLGSREVGNLEKQFRAVTAEVQTAIRATAGVGGWAHDIGASIDFVSAVGNIPYEQFSDESVKSALHDALEKTIADYNVPSYCHESIYTGAAWQVLLLAQRKELDSKNGPKLREYKQQKTAFQKGFVPEQLKLVSSSSVASVDGLLGKPNPGVISGKMTALSAKIVLAANAGVTAGDIGPSKSDLLAAFGLSGLGLWLARYAASKVSNKNIPLWSIAVGAAGITGVYAYFSRNTIRRLPVSLERQLEQKVLMLAKSGPVTTEYKKTFANTTGGASTGQSTKNLVLLQDGAHKFTVAEVQYLLGLWGSNPKPTINGVWSDETLLAVRDYQTRAFIADKLFSLADVTGNPFDDNTSKQLRRFVKKLLTDPLYPHVVTVEEAQALLGLKITGIEDVATQAKLKASFMGPVATSATQKWLRSVAVSAVSEFV